MTVPDILKLVAILIAIQGIFVTLILFYLKDKWNESKIGMDKIKRNAFFIEKMAANLADTIVNIRTEMQFQNGLFQRIFHATGLSEEFSDRLDAIYKKNEYEMERCIQTLMIFTDSLVRRESAFKQLVESFGNADTLVSMQALLEYEAEQVEILHWAIDGLRKRLNTNSENLNGNANIG